MKRVLVAIAIVLFNFALEAQCSKVWEKKRDYGISLVTGASLAYVNNSIYNLVSNSTFSIIYYGGGETDLYRYSPNGDSIWLFKTSYTYPNAFLTDPVGNSYYSGNRYQKYVFNDYYLVKSDSSGKKAWINGQEYKKETYLSSIFFDNDYNVLMLTSNTFITPNVEKLTKFNKSGVILWEKILDNDYYVLGIKVDSKNHIHLMYSNYIIELDNVGNFINLIVMKSMFNSGFGNPKNGNLILLENGNEINYLAYISYENNNYILDKIDKNGNVYFENKQANPIKLDHSDHAFLNILPDESILFGGLIDSSSLEGGKTPGPGDVFYVLNPDGTLRFKKNLYNKSNLIDLRINDQYIFTTGLNDSIYYVDIHDFYGNRYCDPIKLPLKEKPLAILPTKGTEFYVTTFNNDDYNHKFSKLYKFNENSVSTSDYLNSELLLYPNPSTQSINIKGLLEGEEYYYKIYNIMGISISNGTISNKDDINIDNLSNGIYFITFEKGGERQVLKFVKQ